MILDDMDGVYQVFNGVAHNEVVNGAFLGRRGGGSKDVAVG